MIQQFTLLLAALISWCIDFFPSTDKKPHRILRIILLIVVFAAGCFAIRDAKKQENENEQLNEQISELTKKPEIVLIANCLEVSTIHPIVCTSSGGVFKLEFKYFNRSDKAASDATLTIFLPNDLEVINTNDWRKMSGSSVPSPNEPTKSLYVKNHYQRTLSRTIFPHTLESIGEILFVENGDKPQTRCVMVNIDTKETSGCTDFTLELNNDVEQAGAGYPPQGVGSPDP